VRFLEHTADEGVEAEGATLEECFARAAAGVFDLFLSAPESMESQDDLPVEVSADGASELLVAWLEELLFLFETRGLPLFAFEVQEVGGSALRGRAVAAVGAKVEHLGPAVKGVTRHQLEVRRLGRSWRARVYLDV
jgi:SHS2 domain-containing protein